MNSKLLKNVLVLAALLNLACIALISGAEPTIVPCRDTIIRLDVNEGYIAATLYNGGVQLFDSVGQELTYLDIDLNVPEFEIDDDTIVGHGRRVGSRIYDCITHIPSHQTLLVFRNTYDPYTTGIWGLIKNSVRNLFKGNSVLEFYDMESQDRYSACEYTGYGLNGTVNDKKTLVAIETFFNESVWLQIIRIRDGKILLKENLAGGVHFAFGSTALYAFSSDSLYRYDFTASDSLINRRTENLGFAVNPFLVFKPSFGAEEKIIFLTKLVTGKAGPAKLIGNRSLYERCMASISESYFNEKDGMWSIQFKVLEDDRVLVHNRKQNTLAIADLSTGAWDQVSEADVFGSYLPMSYAILTPNRFVVCDLSRPTSEFSIADYKLPNQSGH